MSEEEHLTDEQLLGALECLLFSTREPLSLKRLTHILDGVTAAQLRELILRLQLHYEKHSPGLQVVEVARGYQIATRQQFYPWVSKLVPVRARTDFSQATLETLAIIAYKQPVNRKEIESVRGVDCGGILRQMVDEGLIKTVEPKKKAMRGHYYAVTENFMKTFGLSSLRQLPSLSELKKEMKKP